MANPVWPPSLGNDLETPGFSGTIPDGFVETEFEQGPARRDAVAAAEDEVFEAFMWFDRTQEATLKTFFKTTLKGGTLKFDWQHPITEAAATMEFLSGGLKYTLRSAIRAQYRLRLRILI